jgi:hypothetical protein
MEPKSYEGFAGRKSTGNYVAAIMGDRKGESEMTLRHINPRSVEWYEALIDDGEEALEAHEALALRTMKALEDAEIRIALSRAVRTEQREGRLVYRFPTFQIRLA